MTNLLCLLVAAENAKDANTAAHKEKYVFKMARCWGSPCFAAAALKLGQNIHKKIVPTIENMSELLDDPYKCIYEIQLIDEGFGCSYFVNTSAYFDTYLF